MNLLEQYICQLLIEGRVEDVKKKYPILADRVVLLKDPSGNNKYLMWMAKEWDKGILLNRINQVVVSFHKNIQRFKGKDKDINSYDSIVELEDKINSLSELSKTQKKKVVKNKEADIVFENENVIIVEPKSHKASCYYGSGTKWCSTERSNKYWEEYYLESFVTLYYILNKKVPKWHRYNKVAVAVYPQKRKAQEVFDALDHRMLYQEANKFFKEFDIPKSIFVHRPLNGVYVNRGKRKTFYKDGKRHREDGPAVEKPDGTKVWYINGELHREDGPAIEHPNGEKSWFLSGKQYSEEDFKKKMNREEK